VKLNVLKFFGDILKIVQTPSFQSLKEDKAFGTLINIYQLFQKLGVWTIFMISQRNFDTL